MMSIVTVISVICLLGISVFLSALIMSAILDEHPLFFSKRRCLLILAASLLGFAASTIYAAREADIEHAADTAAWAVQGCPVYKSMCGSAKSPYECERRGAIVGRNQVGDIFVNAYPICKN